MKQYTLSVLHRVLPDCGRTILLFSFVFFFILSVRVLHAQDEEEAGWNMHFSGYYKNLFMYQGRGTYYDTTVPPREKRMFSDLNRIKLSPEIVRSDSFILHADMNMTAVSASYGKTAVFRSYWIDPDYNDLWKPSKEFLNDEHLYLQGDIQNIYVKMVMGSFTTTLGRQQLRFGSSRLWNPLDLLSPFSPLVVEGAEERRGIDALRIDWYPFGSSEFTAVVNPARSGDEFRRTSAGSSNYLARMKFGLAEIDLALLAGYTSKRINYGMDFQWVLFDGMLTGVVLYSDPQKGRQYTQCGAGYEYTFASGLYLLAEYFYNSLPVNEDPELEAGLGVAALLGIDDSNYYIISNRMITYNSHYLSLAAGYDFHPLLRGEIFTIYDFPGRGLFMNASLRMNSTQNSEISAGFICAVAGKGRDASDFDNYDRKPACYASVQVYF